MGDGEFPIIEGFTRGFPSLERDARALGVGKRWARWPSKKTPSFLRTSEHSEPLKATSRVQLSTLQKDFSRYKRLHHRVPLRGTPAVHSKLYSIYRSVMCRHGEEPGVFGNTSDLGKETTGDSQGLLFPPHPLCLLCCLAQAQLRGTSSTPLTSGDMC